jgi:hypothetical protein
VVEIDRLVLKSLLVSSWKQGDSSAALVGSDAEKIFWQDTTSLLKTCGALEWIRRDPIGA